MLLCQQRGTQEGRANRKLIKIIKPGNRIRRRKPGFFVSKCPYNYIIYIIYIN
nr:MAG TPA: hypothetical protein [Caudoviricetes sp.]